MSERLVLVTGASGALGSAAVRAFHEDGFEVLAVDRIEPAVAWSDGVEDWRIDLTDVSAPEAITEALAGRPLHHLVGVAGGALPGEPETQDDPLKIDIETFRASLDANLVTQFTALRAAMPALRTAGPADRSVQLISSFNALSAQGMPGYSAAKAGLIGMMHALVRPLGRDGIRINVVAPGTIRTPRTERLWRDEPGHFARLEAGTAAGRLGTPDDVAEVCLGLTRMRHVTGQVLVVDGGQMTIHR